MRQIQNLSSTPGCRNASTCGFSARKGQCAQGFRYLPHTSDGWFRKCGEKSRSADQTPVLRLRDLRFCCQKSGCARWFSIFPRTSVKRGNTKRPVVKITTNSAGKHPLKRKNRLSAVPTDQAGRTPLPASRSELRLSSNASVKLHVSRKTPATTSFPNRDVSFDRPNLTSEQKEGRRINPLQVSPES